MCLCHGHHDSQRGIRGKNPHAYRPPFLTPFPFLFRSFAFPTHPEAKPCDSGPEPKQEARCLGWFLGHGKNPFC